MNIKINRKVRILTIFLTLMVLCTILSRVAASVLVAQVNVEKPGRGKLTFTCSGNGNVVPVQEKLIFLWPGQQVEWAADVGSTLKAGDCLVQFRMEYLQQTIESKQAELTQLELQAGQQQVSARGTARVPSAERAMQTLTDAQRRLQEAQQKAAEAQAAYDQFQSAQVPAAQAQQSIGSQAASAQLQPADAQSVSFQPQPIDSCSSSSQPQSTDGQPAYSPVDNAGSAYQPADSSLSQQELENDLQEAQTNVETARQSVIQAQNEYNFALKEDAAQDANEANAIQSAQLGVQALNAQIDTARKALEQLISYQNAGGKILAEQDCTVLTSGIQAGTFTTGAEVLVTGNGGWKLKGLVTAKDKEKLRAGVDAEIRLGAGKKKTVKIESIGAESLSNTASAAGENSSSAQQVQACWYANLPENTTADSGDTFEWTVQSGSEKEYEQLIPLSALREDSDGAYCLILSEEESMLGTVQTARRVPVTVLEKDSENAAVTSALKDTDQVIVSSEKYVGEGDRVRIKS